jgi:hypothetical protein
MNQRWMHNLPSGWQGAAQQYSWINRLQKIYKKSIPSGDLQ